VFLRDDLNWLQQLPYTISIPSWKAIFVHAGLIPDLPLSHQDSRDMTMMRNIFSTDELTESGQLQGHQWKGSSKTNVGEPWVNYWNGCNDGIHVYFGHDAKRGLQRSMLSTGLDTGCAYGKQLTAIILPENKIVQVSARRVYQPIHNKS
jgi:bis(5'-nucleosyl)-tetraphosphatase (symmetrical)